MREHVVGFVFRPPPGLVDAAAGPAIDPSGSRVAEASNEPLGILRRNFELVIVGIAPVKDAGNVSFRRAVVGPLPTPMARNVSRISRTSCQLA